MQKFLFLIAIVLVFVISSCSNQKDSPIELPEDLTVYKIDNDSVDGVNLEDVLVDYSFIGLTLPENMQIRGVQKIQFHNDRIYMLDMLPGGGNPRILSFDTDGNFIYVIDRPGRGPGEYEYIYDFALIDEYLILSTTTRIIYNNIEDGSLSHSVANRFDDNWVQWIYFFDDQTGVTDGGRGRANLSMKHIRFFDTETMTFIQEDVPFPSHAVMMGHSYHNLFKTPSGLHVRPLNSRIVYSIEPQSDRRFEVKKAYAFDFGDKFVTEQFLRTSFSNMNEIFRERIDKEFIHLFDVFHTETTLFVSYLYQDRRYVFLYDFENETYLNIDSFNQNTIGVSLSPATTYQNYIVSLAYPWDFDDEAEIHPDLKDLFDLNPDEGQPVIVKASFRIE